VGLDGVGLDGVVDWARREGTQIPDRMSPIQIVRKIFLMGLCLPSGGFESASFTLSPVKPLFKYG
jgi:hypothetical protein